MRAFRQAVVVVTAAALVGLSAAASTAADTPLPRTIDRIAVDVPGVVTLADLEAFLLSSEPKTIQVDAATGDIRQVSAGPELAASSRVVVGGDCQEVDACLFGSESSGVVYRVSGEGTITGRWTDRGGYASGPYNMWVTLGDGSTIAPFGPWSQVVFWRDGVYLPQTITGITVTRA